MSANGFLAIVRTGMLQGEALNSALETVSRNLHDIITLTNDILFLQEMDLILPAFQATDLGAVVAAAVEQQRSRAEQNQVGLRVQIDPGLPRVMADPKSLERAVAAILDNAIKFSPEGGEVNIRVLFEGSKLAARVEDHGVGIPPEALPRIFDRFFHLDSVSGHLFRGAGVGLCIARQVVEQHKGTIDAQSQLGEGSTFTVWLEPA
jgi:signal transduction histidine kinase